MRTNKDMPIHAPGKQRDSLFEQLGVESFAAGAYY
jgi:hypothetical protein